MPYEYIKALHIIFIVTWFSGLFYMVRLFVYHAEAQVKPEPEKTILTQQFNIMILRLWRGITVPSSILTLILGLSLWHEYNHFNDPPDWLKIKLVFVMGLYLYHGSVWRIYKQ
ncbi:MAG: protoporphyrinogen IX oxidase, partial [Chitinophagia bacterium]|nr:protoporphyrinogen IX oxidase [Chitinophagia bacterium]